jgi:hypothetical protein
MLREIPPRPPRAAEIRAINMGTTPARETADHAGPTVTDAPVTAGATT